MELTGDTENTAMEDEIIKKNKRYNVIIIIYEQTVWYEEYLLTDANGRERAKTAGLQNFQRCNLNKTSPFGDTNRETKVKPSIAF
jgi:hypothetical protein